MLPLSLLALALPTEDASVMSAHRQLAENASNNPHGVEIASMILIVVIFVVMVLSMLLLSSCARHGDTKDATGNTKLSSLAHGVSLLLSVVIIGFVAAVLADGRSVIVLKEGELPIVTDPSIVSANLDFLLGRPYGIGAWHDQFGRKWWEHGGVSLNEALAANGAEGTLAALPGLITENGLSHPVPFLDCNELQAVGTTAMVLCFIAIITSFFALLFHSLSLVGMVPAKLVKPVGALLHFLLTVGFLVVVILVSVAYTKEWTCDQPVIPKLTLSESFDLNYAIGFATCGFLGSFINLLLSIFLTSPK
uniref:Uncharacterized protein n=1 Tax=Chrysotila haptonemofera TaxID=35135 RepID=Q0E9R4_CHRHP|nr:hypothetical protein [Pleurochrysis haptonemofera]